MMRDGTRRRCKAKVFSVDMTERQAKLKRQREQR
jgi:hypothetical protein